MPLLFFFIYNFLHALYNILNQLTFLELQFHWKFILYNTMEARVYFNKNRGCCLYRNDPKYNCMLLEHTRNLWIQTEAKAKEKEQRKFSISLEILFKIYTGETTYITGINFHLSVFAKLNRSQKSHEQNKIRQNRIWYCLYRRVASSLVCTRTRWYWRRTSDIL